MSQYSDNPDVAYHIGHAPTRMKPHNRETWANIAQELRVHNELPYARLVAICKGHASGSKSAPHPYQFVDYCINRGWLEAKRIKTAAGGSGFAEHDGGELMEAALHRATNSEYERNASARAACIRHYGPTCAVCGTSFEATYGAIGRGFIHVHHLVPLSEIGKAYEVDPIRDLRPVCPNCHAMLHTRTPPYTIREMQALIREARKIQLFNPADALRAPLISGV